MPYVERSNGAVVGTYYSPVEGVASEFLSEEDPEVVAFLSPPFQKPPLSLDAYKIADGLRALGFSQSQVEAFLAAAS